ncbi:MAG: nucleotidyltransferase family protein [Deltaproteobacteria bacterium]|nr:nucleotidyltransferase family protein [Deltaproteobacteria bacterium]
MIRCLHLETSISPSDRLKPPPDTDWPGLLKAALGHGVFPFLYRWLADSCPETAPPEVLRDWRRLYKIQARQNLEKTTELIQLLNQLASLKIPAVPFKGPVLAAVAYGDIALRQFVDLDILVSRKDIEKVKDLLLSQGYTSRYSLTKKQERLHLKYGVEFTFEHPRRTMLDVHWRFAAGYLGGGLDPEEALARRVPVQVLGKTVSTLHPEDHLLLLCQHGTFHSWANLSLVSDVARLVHSQNNWNWPRLLQRAQVVGQWRQTLLGLSLAQGVLGAPVPAEVIREAEAEPVVAAVHRWVARNMWKRTGEPLSFFEQTSFYLQTQDSFKDQVRHVWCRVCQPTVEDWRWAPLPDRLYGLYYLIRPLRLGWQGLVQPLMRRLTGSLGWAGRGLAARSTPA